MSKVQASATCDTCGTKNCTCSKELKQKALSEDNPVTKCSNKYKVPKTSCDRCGKPKKDACLSASEIYLWGKREKTYECPPMPVVDCVDCKPAWLNECDSLTFTPPYPVPEGVCIQPLSFKGPDPGCPDECNNSVEEADTPEAPEEDCEEPEPEVQEECEVEEEVLECGMEEDDEEEDCCEVDMDECDDEAEADDDNDDDDEC